MSKKQFKKTISSSKVSQTSKTVNSLSFFDKYNTSTIHYLIILVLLVLVYGWAVSFDYSLDDTYVTELVYAAKNIKTVFTQLYASNGYRPITILTFWIENKLFNGLTPERSHFINLIIFYLLLISIYKFIIVSKFNLEEKQLSVIALLTAIFFLVHPNHVSVVANIKSRDNLQSMLFGLLAAIQFIKMIDFKQYWRMLLFIFLMSLSLLSKLDGYSFFIIPVLVILLFRKVQKANYKRIVLVVIATFIIALIVNNLTSGLEEKFTNPALKTDIQNFTENPLLTGATFTQRLSLTFTTLFYYIKFLIIPFGYYFYFGYNQIPVTNLFSIINIFSFIILTVCFIYSVYKFKLNKIYIFCFLGFLLSIAYAANFFIFVAGIVMDRYSFIASLYFFIILSYIIVVYFNINNLKLITNKVFIILLLIWIPFTIYRSTAWKTYFTLIERDMPHLGKSVNALRIAGGTYIHFALEEELKPNFNKALTDSFIVKGERFAQQSIKVYDKSYEVWELLGLCDFYRKDYNKALAKFKTSYACDTNYLSAANYVGVAFWDLYQYDSAAYYFDMVTKREAEYTYSANNYLDLSIQQNWKQTTDSLFSIYMKKYSYNQMLVNKYNNYYK